ncbi:MAG: polyprenyl diphosphate synthase [Patescibacteria group bacterium]
MHVDKNQDLETLVKLSPALLPKNIAVALDGNRRWAKKLGLPEIEGHRVGVENTRRLIKRASELGVKSITFWIFSTENFRRDKNFLTDIFSLAREYLGNGKYFDELNALGAKVSFIGDLGSFPKDISEKVLYYVSKSKPSKHVIDVVFAFGYGGRDEIVRAVKKVVKAKISEDEITEEVLSKHMDFKEEIDLLIRTGGKVRTSGFLIWQAPYAELYFTDTLCPDFKEEEFDKAVSYFTECARNFGR